MRFLLRVGPFLQTHFWKVVVVCCLHQGNPKQIYVIRGARKLKDFTSIKALHLDASNAANFLLATHLELRPKDVIFVGSQPVTNWNRVINQIIPSLGLSDMNIPTIN